MYHGRLRSSQTAVAVKCVHTEQLAAAMGQTTAQQMAAEIRTLSKHQHVRLVPLLGYSMEQPECIVYAFMSGGSLQDRLACKARPMSRELDSRPLLMHQRVRIATEVAEGLAFLHREARIIHRDIKSSNILLDEHDSAKISDFGIVRSNPFDDSQDRTHTMTVNLAGTSHYLP